MSFLELQQIHKIYPDGTHAVKGVDLQAGRGEFIVLLGPSGCGKTTTLRMVAGLEIATRGAIHLDRRQVTSLRPSERDVGFVFQFYALYPHLKVRENIAFPLKSIGMPKSERDPVMRNVVDNLGITHLLNRYPKQLSGGDQQRVALARAMVRRPAVFLMDEPLGTLDADQRLEMREFIRRHQLEMKVTTIYVTHDQEEAMSLADRVVVMDAGEICQVGTPVEVYDDPASLFVANFVGSPGMNLIEGEILPTDGRPEFHAGSDGAALPVRAGIEPGKRTLGIRPEYIHPGADGPIRGAIVANEYLGSWRCLHVDTPMGRLVVRADARDPYDLGGTVALTFEDAHTCFFDPATGRRI